MAINVLDLNLRNADRCFVKQDAGLLEMVVDLGVPNKYKVINELGVTFLEVIEATSETQLWLLGTDRDLRLVMWDQFDREVLAVYRPWEHMAETLIIEYPMGCRMGVVRRTCTQGFCSSAQYVIMDGTERNELLNIQGPSCCSGFCGSVTFEVSSGGICKRESAFFTKRNCSGLNLLILFAGI